MTKSIAILTEKPGTFLQSRYLIVHLARHWAQQGYRVAVCGPIDPPEADVAILHVDMTIVGSVFLTACRKYPVVLNGRFTDNSKRIFSRNLLEPESGYNGPVIIKTNANFGGLFELKARYGEAVPPHAVPNFNDPGEIQWGKIESIPTDQYPVLDSMEQVPPAVWNNPHLVVEKFMPELDGNGLYCMRGCLFFGDREVNILVKSRRRIIKGHDVADRQILSEKAPDAVQKIKREHHMDFGRIDYAIHRGEVVIFDANKTATLSRQVSGEMAELVIKPLALGIGLHE